MNDKPSTLGSPPFFRQTMWILRCFNMHQRSTWKVAPRVWPSSKLYTSWRIFGKELATWEAHWPPQWPSRIPRLRSYGSHIFIHSQGKEILFLWWNILSFRCSWILWGCSISETGGILMNIYLLRNFWDDSGTCWCRQILLDFPKHPSNCWRFFLLVSYFHQLILLDHHIGHTVAIPWPSCRWENRYPTSLQRTARSDHRLPARHGRRFPGRHGGTRVAINGWFISMGKSVNGWELGVPPWLWKLPYVCGPKEFLVETTKYWCQRYISNHNVWFDGDFAVSNQWYMHNY